MFFTENMETAENTAYCIISVPFYKILPHHDIMYMPHPTPIPHNRWLHGNVRCDDIETQGNCTREMREGEIDMEMPFMVPVQSWSTLKL